MLLPVTQIYRGETKHLIITLYYTTGSIMLQGRAFCGWVGHELECRKFSVNAIDKLWPLRPSATTDDSDNTASVGNDSATAAAATTVVGGTPTTSDNNNCITSVGCHDTTAAAAVSAVSDDSDNVV